MFCLFVRRYKNGSRLDFYYRPYANAGISFIQNEPKSIAYAYNIRKSTTDFVRLYIEGVIDNEIGKFQGEKKKERAFCRSAVCYSGLFFSQNGPLSSFSFIESTFWGMYCTCNNDLSKFDHDLPSGVGVAVTSFQT